MRIDIPNFIALVSDNDLQDPLFFQKELLYKFQNSLMNCAKDLIQTLADNPLEAIEKFKDYEKILLNFAQLIYWMRPLQALLKVRERLEKQVADKEKLRKEVGDLVKELKNEVFLIAEQ